MSRRRPHLALALALVAAVAAPSCTSSQEASAPTPAPPVAAPDPAPAPQGASSPGESALLRALAEEPRKVEPAPPPEITVLDAGAEPRATMRAKVKAGQEQPMNMTMTIGMAMSMAGSQVPYIKMPPTEMQMRTKVTSVSSSGDFRYEFDLHGIDVRPLADTPPDLVTGLKSAMSGLVGMRGHSVVSDRGEVREADFQLPAGAPPQVQQQMQGMRQSIQQIAVPFPEEAVGVGARWEVVARIPELNGMSLSQTSTYEIVERAGDRLRLKTSILQRAEPQVMTPPGMPPGAIVRLESMSSSGTGEMTLDLQRLVPISAAMTLGSKIAMLIESGGQKQAMNMEMDMGMEIRGE